jgi:hypothetical protein
MIRKPMTKDRPRVGLLFIFDFDRRALALRSEADFDHAGFDLFRFPSQLGLATFDMDRFVHAQIRRGRRRRWQGVFSAHEQYGALAAALVAQGLGLPGTDPKAILAAQHKAHARAVLDEVAPEANLPFRVLPARLGEPLNTTLITAPEFPLYAKPVKAAFSVLARRIDTEQQLRSHLTFNAWERYLAYRLLAPFERIRERLLPDAGSAHRMLLESPIDSNVPQYNLDGFVQNGEVLAIGVVDAVMYPGTQAFMRWDYPSQLDPGVQARALDIARRFLNAIGFTHGLFNLEFFHDPRSDRITVIECNPRMASQFSDLYRRVLGLDLHALAIRLALGQSGALTPREAPTAAVASSLVYRSFPGEVVPVSPGLAQRQALHERFPDALVFDMPKSSAGRAWDYKWTGSHRYGLLHLGASDWVHFEARAREASVLLGWPTRVARRQDAGTP